MAVKIRMKRVGTKNTPVFRIVVTDGRGDVVLVNRAAEVLLGKSAGTVIEQGFLQVFDNPADMRCRLEAPASAAEINSPDSRR